mgnify:FL=1|tara:strand:- start:397 stop:618 length:222 start_codon:yes stop_codon:yes gene_type:complete
MKKKSYESQTQHKFNILLAKIPLEWVVFVLSGKLPFGFPVRPDLIYADLGWKDWEDFMRGQDLVKSKGEKLRR